MARSSRSSDSERGSSRSPLRRDREVCVFYKRIGACRHGNKCSRLHVPPKTSRTVMIRNLYRYVRPTTSMLTSMSIESKRIFEEFYEEVFTELEDAYGRISQMHVCENMGEHLIGNVYVKFERLSTAERAVEALNNRFFAGMPVFAELSPVENFRDAVCRQHDVGECVRGGFCNFLHIKPVSSALEDRLEARGRSCSPTSSYDSLDSSWESLSSDSDSNRWSSNASDDSDSASNFSSYLSSPKSETVGSTDDEDEENDEIDEGPVPKAFQVKPLQESSPGSSEASDTDDEEVEVEEVDENVQMSRRLRWQIFGKQIMGEWNESKEQQYIFHLLEMS